jgi:hypothetical protein
MTPLCVSLQHTMCAASVHYVNGIDDYVIKATSIPLVMKATSKRQSDCSDSPVR